MSPLCVRNTPDRGHRTEAERFRKLDQLDRGHPLRAALDLRDGLLAPAEAVSHLLLGQPGFLSSLNQEPPQFLVPRRPQLFPTHVLLPRLPWHGRRIYRRLQDNPKRPISDRIELENGIYGELTGIICRDSTTGTSP